MKARLSLLFLVFACSVSFFAARIVFAETNTTPLAPSPSTSVSPSTTPMPQNPAPPIGLTPCGKTMCLATETCVQYKQDKDEHCVPTELLPKIQAVPPQDLPEDPDDLCPKGTGVFPPNSSCTNNMKTTQAKILEYDKTCIYQPVVKYEGERWSTPESKGNRPFPPEKTQPYTMCGKGYAGPGNAPIAPGSIPKYECAVNMLVYTDVRDAELGSYGPSTDMRDKNSEEYKSSDYIAQNYLYDAFFGKSLDLSDNNRESSRTYWRLLSANTQANLRSFILNMVNENKMNDIKFEYVESTGDKKFTSTKEIYSKLKDQYILFWHWPFIRKGCLTDYPVCPEFAQAIAELKPNAQSLSETIKNTPLLGAGIQLAVSSYQALTSNLQDTYAAFIPLDFDSVRSYILRKKTAEEEDMYRFTVWHDIMLHNDQNKSRYGTPKPLLTNISRENIPYLGAIEQGILSPKYGILSSIQPSWVTQKYATDEGSPISNYRLGNKPEDFPEVKIAKQNLLSFLQEKASLNPFSIVTNTALWLYDQAKDLFADPKEASLDWYTDFDTDLPIDAVRPAYVNYKNCPLPLSYHLLSPKTDPQDSVIPPGEPRYNDHHQIVTIWGPQVGWSWAPIENVQCGGVSGSKQPKNKKNPYDPDDEICICKAWKDDEETYPDPNNNPCYNYTRHWNVFGIEDGKALTVFNNPKAMDVKKAIVQDKSFALYNTLIPEEFNKKTLPDASIDAPYAANYSAFSDLNGSPEVNPQDDLSGCTPLKGAATAPNGQSCVLNKVEPINRINNNAQDTAHLLQNCWTVPEGLQNSLRCKYETMEATTSGGVCNGQVFEKILGGTVEKPSEKASSLFSKVGNLSEDLIKAYAEAEAETGVPCEVLAGIHYREGSNNPDQDLQSGAPLNGRSIKESAVQAAQELLSKAGGAINDIDTLIKALSYYNGGGNANCQPTVSCSAIKNNRCGSNIACDSLPSTASSGEIKAACTCGIEAGSCRSVCNNGYPFTIPTSPGLCPPKGIGYDDPYAVELWKAEHLTMYVLYTYDCTQTPPVNQNRLGTFTFALEYYLNNSSKNNPAPQVDSGGSVQEK